MYPKLFVLTLGVALSASACGGCGDDDANPSKPPPSTTPTVSDNNQPDDMGPGGDGIKREPLASSKARVRFKGGERWGAELARGLGLERGELCQELSSYDCIGEVHAIALGGVEPYRLRIDTPLPKPPVTAPIAVERVALSACSTRAERDLADVSKAVIFKEMSAEPTAAELRAMGQRLVEGLLSREAQEDDLNAMVAFYGELEGSDDERRKAWATLSCFALASSLEMLFY